MHIKSSKRGGRHFRGRGRGPAERHSRRRAEEEGHLSLLLGIMPKQSKDRISYFYDAEVGSVYYGPNHPMKPHRLCMTHHLVMGYELHKQMELYRPRKAHPVELAQFHSEDYVDFLARVTPEHVSENLQQLQRYNLGEDCPIFEGLFNFCQVSF